MRNLLRQCLVYFLCNLLFLGPGMTRVLWAQDDQDNAPPEEVRALQQLAKKGYLGDKKDFYLSAKTLTDDDITDGLLKIQDGLSLVDLKALKPGDKNYRVEDLQALLALVKDKAEDIRDRKVSAWKYEKRIEKMIALLTPAENAPIPAAGAPVKVVSAAAGPQPAPTATPIPGPSREEWNQVKSDQRDLLKKVGDLQDAYDKRMDAIQTTDNEIKLDNAGNREQLKLVKNLVDQVQSDLAKTNSQLDEMVRKAGEKEETDTELGQEIQVMRKDVRDNTQDVSILKQEVAKLDLSQEKKGQNPLDDFLTSKWLPTGALAVGLAALIVSVSRK